jgi:signal peptide peptidase SppA
MPKHDRVLHAVAETPWAITRAKLDEILGFMARVRAGKLGAAEEAAAKASFGAAEPAPARIRVGSVEIIPVQGVIAQKMNLVMEMSGGTSTELLAHSIQRAIDDSQVSSILLDIDSPGGSVFGVPELGEFLLAAREKKRIVAQANPVAASAAYWIAACCSEIAVAPSGQVGSIGVLSVHDDVSQAQEKEGVKTTVMRAGRYKAEGNPFEPLSEEARADMQSKLDSYYDMFVRSVAAGRGVDPRSVRSGFGQGRMVMAAEAKAAGMADKVSTLDGTLGRLLMRNARGSGEKAADMTIRDFEALLRDEVGLSNSKAKHLASLAFKAEPPSGTGAAAVTEPVTESGADEQGLREALRAYVGQPGE